MRRLLRKIHLLLWKNMKVIQRRKMLITIMILLPLSPFMLCAAVKKFDLSDPDFDSEETVVYKPAVYFEAITEEEIVNSFPKDNVRIYYVPSNSFTDDLMEEVRKKLSFDKQRLVSFSSETELESQVEINFEEATIYNNVLGVVFSNNNRTKIPNNLNYKIRSANGIWSTDFLFISSVESALTIELYLQTGFLALQIVIDSSFIALVKPKSNSDLPVKITIQEFPSPPHYKMTGGSESLPVDLLCILFTLFEIAFLFSHILGNIVKDKQSGVTELMKLMGLSRLMLWLSWFFLAMFIGIIFILAAVFLLTYPFYEDTGALLPTSSAGVVLVFLLLVFVAMAVCTFAISTLIHRPNFAVILGLVIMVIQMAIPAFSRKVFKVKSLTVSVLMCLLPLEAMRSGFITIGAHEKNGVGVSWSNLSQPLEGAEIIPRMDHVLLILTADILLYTLLTWYLDSVMPGKYGVPKSWKFCFAKSYWCTCKVDAEKPADVSGGTNQSNFEAPPQGSKVGIRIQELKKIYDSGKVAVDDVTIDFYEDQITALLGRNGAGKTTVMSIITGMLSSSSGSVWINGYNITTDVVRVRESLGLCPQHNMLFAHLTVLDHLIFYGMLKGCSHRESRKSADTLLTNMRLRDKSKLMVRELSGGMKRKLSLAIALIGNSKVVVLDEPTSGLDPEARRQIWDVLLSLRGQRTVILTTHYMEEADILSDRIAIMDHGKVQCYGTSHFLKAQYGAGYVMKLLIREPSDVAKISKIVQDTVRGGKLKARHGSELNYVLPVEQKPQFPKLFNVLETTKAELGITSIGVSLTTLEDVFLSVGGQAAEKSRDGQASARPTVAVSSGGYKRKTKGLAFKLQQIKALFLKKILLTKRKWLSFIVLILLTVLFAFLTVWRSLAVVNPSLAPVEPARTLTLSEYNSTVVLFTNTSSSPVVRWYEGLVLSASSLPQPIPAQSGILDALVSAGVADLEKYQVGLVVATDFNLTADKLIAKALFSSFGLHSAPISLNLVNNALLKSYINSDEYSITAVNHPLKKKLYDVNVEERLSLEAFWMILLPTGLLFLVGNFLMFAIVERVSKSKRLQLLTGVSPPMYWFTCFLWDLLVYCAVVVTIVVLIAICDIHQAFGGFKEMGILMLILFLYGVSGIPCAYFISYFSKSQWAGFQGFIYINLFLGWILMRAVRMIGTILEGSNVESKWPTIEYRVGSGLLLWPHYCLSEGLSRFCQQALYNGCASITATTRSKICEKSPADSCCREPYKQQAYTELESETNPFGIGRMLLFLFFDSILYFAIIFLIDYGVLSRICELLKRLRRLQRVDEDDLDGDVRAEMNRVKECDTNVLNVKEVMKVYGCRAMVVKGVSFGVKPGECFGLLGANGAGKTTTFRMLTGDVTPTRGDAQIMNFSLVKNRAKFLTQIGYCPQFDAVIEVLTGREMLNLYATLRGIDKTDVENEVKWWLKEMDLLEYQDVLCGTYSGGNKRKLSTAMALIGDPPLIFLDEPSCGVDPVARRKLWSIMAKIQKTEHALVLTSHSMDECEALCDRLAIMVKGQFACLGEIQLLKQKFGKGFMVTVKLNAVGDQEAHAKTAKRNFEETLTDAVLKDQHQGLLYYHLTNQKRAWSSVFTIMEDMKARTEAIEDYSISETSLEQLFLSFAKTGQ